MQLDEAVAIQQYLRDGKAVQANLVREATRVVQSHSAKRIAEATYGENHAWMPSPLSTTQRERVNMILAFRLGLALGKFDNWATT